MESTILQMPATIEMTGHLTENATQAREYDIVVFSSFKWNSSFQRPQNIMSRFSDNYKILYVAEPEISENEVATAELIYLNDHLNLLQSYGTTIKWLPELLKKYVSNIKIPVGWFYSAGFADLIDQMEFNRIVYDCTDFPMNLYGSGRQGTAQEGKLLAAADIIFTSSKYLHDERKKLDDNIYYFPGSPDRMHFEKALENIPIPADIKNIKKPIVGYHGEIDDKIDLKLILETAALLPEVSFVLIGPVVNIAIADLPHAPNIHYLGNKSYQEIPGYVKAFDVAMLPYILNDVSRHISVVKPMEYMAAKKPVISTGAYALIGDFSHCISIVFSAREFAHEIENLLEKPDTFLTHNREFEKILDKTSWSNTAMEMQGVLFL